MNQELEIKRILCPIDYSGHTPATLEQAVFLSRCMGAELVILNVVNIRLFEELERYGGRFQNRDNPAGSAMKNIQDEHIEEMKKWLAKVDLKGVEHRAIVSIGAPWEVILETADKEAADLIVMGTKGRGSLTRQIRFGSSAEKVFRRARCRVMFVR